MKFTILFAAVLCLIISAFATTSASEISPGAILAGVNNWEGRIDYFNSASNKDHSLIGFSVTWTYEFGVAPPDFIGDTIGAGAVPIMTWMSCGNDIWDSGYPLQDIIDGRFDDYLRRSAKTLKAYGNRILCRFDQEMNLDIWAWSVTAPWNNGNPQQFVEMWRHVVDIFKQEGANNVEWVWCPNYMSHPFASWNDAKNFYPGDEYVDWIGLDGYSWGSSNTSGNSMLAVSFPWLYDPIIRDFQCTYLKPILICEIGCLDDARYPKEKWIADTYDYLFHYPFIKGIVWLNTHNPATGIQEDFRVIRMYDDALPVPERVSQAYRNAIAGPSFIAYFPTLEEAIPQELACDPLPAANEFPKHEVVLNKRPGSVYRAGDVLAPAYFLYPPTDAANMFVDAYIAIKTPDGTFFSFRPSGFVKGIVPSIENFGVKRLSRAMAFYYTLPGNLSEGEYTVYSGLIRKGQNPALTASQLSFDRDTFTYRH